MKPEMTDFLNKVDIIVFDVDGVLIDTSSSFIETIAVTARFFVNKIMKLDIDLSSLCRTDAEKFKKRSGFNNDWEVTTSLVSYILLNYKEPDKFPSLDSFLNEVDKLGCGIENVYKLMEVKAAPEIVKWIREEAEYEFVRSIFQEFYAGGDNCTELYGFTTKYHDGEGSVENETVLLDINLVKQWKGKMGILTGRAESETLMAIKMIGLNGLDMDLVEFTDYILPDKPCPEKMVKILENAGSKNALFIGDSIDDFMTSVNYRNLNLEPRLEFGLVSKDPANFPNAAHQFAAPTVNELLQVFLALQK